MKRKPALKSEKVIADEILQSARQSIALPVEKRAVKCIVCSSECAPSVAPNTEENLCWVCRRLKISAWRDSDLQASVQE
jgi:hypothetical protein